MKISINIVFSVKRPVMNYIFWYTFIHKLINQSRVQNCAASVVECWVKSEWVLSEVCPRTCSRIKIDLAVELFNLETWNFKNVSILCVSLFNYWSFAKSCVFSLCVKKTRVCRWDAFKAGKLSKITRIFLMPRNHSWQCLYCKWAKSENYDVIKFWVKNSKTNPNCRRKLKLDSNDAECQVYSENI